MKQKFYVLMRKYQKTHWWFVGRRLVINNLLSKLNLPKKNCKIIDLCCGMGSNIQMLEQYGKVTCLDSDKKSIRFLKKMNYSANEINLPEGVSNIPKKQDLICIFDGLEHIKNDQKTIFNIKSRLKKNGYLIITCPAYNWLYGAYDKSLGHYRRYTSREICSLLEKNGFSIVNQGYFNTILFPASLLARLLEFFNFKLREFNLESQNKTLNYVLTQIMKLESNIIKFKLFSFGTSAVVIGKKR